MVSHAVLGYIGAIVASVFFGSNYVPTKNYPTGNGISFVWSFSAGVMIVGLFSIFITGKSVFVATGLLGGSLWASGNMCVVPIVKTIGLGLGLLVWGSTSLITGYFVGKFGWFGVDKQEVYHEAINYVGIVLVVCAMGVFFFIKPTLEKRDYRQIADKSGDIQAPPKEEEEEDSVLDRIPVHIKYPLGVGLAVMSGMLYGVNMLPMSLWVQDQKKHGITPGTLDFVFSHFTGIYLYSSVVFILYAVFTKNTPKIYPAAIFPSIISGAMWGVAQCGLMSATQILGYAVGFPIGSAGPLLVSSTWSVVYFREIRGSKNLSYLAGSFALLLTGIILLALSDTAKI